MYRNCLRAFFELFFLVNDVTSELNPGNLVDTNRFSSLISVIQELSSSFVMIGLHSFFLFLLISMADNLVCLS